jgi:hypothetical protein
MISTSNQAEWERYLIYNRSNKVERQNAAGMGSLKRALRAQNVFPAQKRERSSYSRNRYLVLVKCGLFRRPGGVPAILA